MNPLQRIKHKEIRRIGDFDVTIAYIQEMDYTGKWEDVGYDVFLALKKIGHLWGYPTNSDIQKLLDKETNIL